MSEIQFIRVNDYVRRTYEEFPGDYAEGKVVAIVHKMGQWHCVVEVEATFNNSSGVLTFLNPENRIRIEVIANGTPRYFGQYHNSLKIISEISKATPKDDTLDRVRMIVSECHKAIACGGHPKFMLHSKAFNELENLLGMRCDKPQPDAPVLGDIIVYEGYTIRSETRRVGNVVVVYDREGNPFHSGCYDNVEGAKRFIENCRDAMKLKADSGKAA